MFGEGEGKRGRRRRGRREGSRESLSLLRRGRGFLIFSPRLFFTLTSSFLLSIKNKMAFALASPARLSGRTTVAAAPRRGSALVVRASAAEPVDRRAVLGAGLAGERVFFFCLGLLIIV